MNFEEKRKHKRIYTTPPLKLEIYGRDKDKGDYIAHLLNIFPIVIYNMFDDAISAIIAMGIVFINICYILRKYWYKSSFISKIGTIHKLLPRLGSVAREWHTEVTSVVIFTIPLNQIISHHFATLRK